MSTTDARRRSASDRLTAAHVALSAALASLSAADAAALDEIKAPRVGTLRERALCILGEAIGVALAATAELRIAAAEYAVTEPTPAVGWGGHLRAISAAERAAAGASLALTESADRLRALMAALD
jgi:hypothetical protein